MTILNIANIIIPYVRRKSFNLVSMYKAIMTNKNYSIIISKKSI